MANVRKKSIDQTDEAQQATDQPTQETASPEEAEPAKETEKEGSGAVKKRTSAAGMLLGNRSASRERRNAMREAREERRKRSEALVEEQRAKNEAGYEKAMAFANAADDDFAELTEDDDDFDFGGFEPVAAPVETEDTFEEVVEEKQEKKKTVRRRKASFTLKNNNFEGGEGAVEAMVDKHRAYYAMRNTISVAWRDKAISRLSGLIKKYETPMIEALRRDLGITKYEAYMTEIAPLHEELKHLRKKLSRWTGDKRFLTNISLLPTMYKRVWQPYGTVCIINSWQSPILGALMPFADAIAAGNSVIIKTDGRMWRCNEVLSAMVAEVFKPEYAQIIYGDDYLDELLVKCHFDKVFFCGTREHAEDIMENLHPLAAKTMMLDGPSPCIVDSTTDLRRAAERIMWGKMIHSGQTRISPSVVFTSDKIYKPFINRLYEYVKTTYGSEPIKSKDYPRMVSKKEFDEAVDLMSHLSKNCEVLVGGEYDEKTLRIAPTIILVNSIDDPILKKDIIGPILPVVPYERGEAAFQKIIKMGTPTAFYLFSKNKTTIKYALRNLDFGTGCVNDTMIQIANRRTPYAAVGSAGAGALGGKAGVNEFGTYRTLATGSKNLHSWRRLPFPETVDRIRKKFHYTAR